MGTSPKSPQRQGQNNRSKKNTTNCLEKIWTDTVKTNNRRIKFTAGCVHNSGSRNVRSLPMHPSIPPAPILMSRIQCQTGKHSVEMVLHNLGHGNYAAGMQQLKSRFSPRWASLWTDSRIYSMGVSPMSAIKWSAQCPILFILLHFNVAMACRRPFNKLFV